MSCENEPTIWSRDTGQRIPCFGRCQLIITWTSNVKDVYGKPRLPVSADPLFGVWPPCCETSTVVVAAVERTRPRSIPLAMITMRKSNWVSFCFPYMGFPIYGLLMGLRLAALQAAGARLLMITTIIQLKHLVIKFI